MDALDLAPHPLRVFVVENHPDTLKYFILFLQDLGHTVHHAATMTEALEEVPKADCDVLISDVGLSDGTGWELLRRLREEGLPHPGYAIAMSGFGMNADRAKSEAAGYRHHLLKPFNPDELDVMLEEAGRELEAKAS
jgi:CheY-like chemotaxis protein